MISELLTKPRQLSVIGFPVAVSDYSEITQWCRDKAGESDRAYAVSAANTHLLSLARLDPSFGEVMGKFDLICPDGTPLVWTLNAQLSEEEKLKDRVYGPTLMLEVMKATEGQADESHFFLGGRESTLEKLTQRFANNQIAGTYSPPFGKWCQDELKKMESLIRESGAKFVWVGMGCPKQERWIADHLKNLPPAVYYGIGAAFAFHTGEIKQAPALVQKIGMEWLFRVFAEPRRLWKRYAVYNSLFVFYSLKDYIRG